MTRNSCQIPLPVVVLLSLCWNGGTVAFANPEPTSGCASNHAAKVDERALAIAEIKRLGGVVRSDDRHPDEPHSICLAGKGFGDRHIQLLKPFADLAILELNDSAVTDSGMKRV